MRRARRRYQAVQSELRSRRAQIWNGIFTLCALGLAIVYYRSMWRVMNSPEDQGARGWLSIIGLIATAIPGWGLIRLLIGAELSSTKSWVWFWVSLVITLTLAIIGLFAL